MDFAHVAGFEGFFEVGEDPGCEVLHGLSVLLENIDIGQLLHLETGVLFRNDISEMDDVLHLVFHVFDFDARGWDFIALSYFFVLENFLELT